MRLDHSQLACYSSVVLVWAVVEAREEEVARMTPGDEQGACQVSQTSMEGLRQTEIRLGAGLGVEGQAVGRQARPCGFCHDPLLIALGLKPSTALTCRRLQQCTGVIHPAGA